MTTPPKSSPTNINNTDTNTNASTTSTARALAIRTHRQKLRSARSRSRSRSRSNSISPKSSGSGEGREEGCSVRGEDQCQHTHKHTNASVNTENSTDDNMSASTSLHKTGSIDLDSNQDCGGREQISTSCSDENVQETSNEYEQKHEQGDKDVDKHTKSSLPPISPKAADPTESSNIATFPSLSTEGASDSASDSSTFRENIESDGGDDDGEEEETVTRRSDSSNVESTSTNSPSEMEIDDSKEKSFESNSNGLWPGSILQNEQAANEQSSSSQEEGRTLEDKIEEELDFGDVKTDSESASISASSETNGLWPGSISQNQEMREKPPSRGLSVTSDNINLSFESKYTDLSYDTRNIVNDPPSYFCEETEECIDDIDKDQSKESLESIDEKSDNRLEEEAVADEQQQKEQQHDFTAYKGSEESLLEDNSIEERIATGLAQQARIDAYNTYIVDSDSEEEIDEGKIEDQDEDDESDEEDEEEEYTSLFQNYASLDDDEVIEIDGGGSEEDEEDESIFKNEFSSSPSHGDNSVTKEECESNITTNEEHRFDTSFFDDENFDSDARNQINIDESNVASTNNTLSSNLEQNDECGPDTSVLTNETESSAGTDFYFSQTNVVDTALSSILVQKPPALDFFNIPPPPPPPYPISTKDNKVKEDCKPPRIPSTKTALEKAASLLKQPPLEERAPLFSEELDGEKESEVTSSYPTISEECDKLSKVTSTHVPLVSEESNPSLKQAEPLTTQVDGSDIITEALTPRSLSEEGENMVNEIDPISLTVTEENGSKVENASPTPSPDKCSNDLGEHDKCENTSLLEEGTNGIEEENTNVEEPITFSPALSQENNNAQGRSLISQSPPILEGSNVNATHDLDSLKEPISSSSESGDVVDVPTTIESSNLNEDTISQSIKEVNHSSDNEHEESNSIPLKNNSGEKENKTTNNLVKKNDNVCTKEQEIAGKCLLDWIVQEVKQKLDVEHLVADQQCSTDPLQSIRTLLASDENMNALCRHVTESMQENIANSPDFNSKRNEDADVSISSLLNDSMTTDISTNVGGLKMEKAAIALLKNNQKVDPFSISSVEKSAIATAANFVSFLHKLSYMTGIDSPVSGNPYLEKMVAASFQSSVSNETQNKQDMREIVFGDNSEMLDILEFMHKVSLLDGTEDDNEFDAECNAEFDDEDNHMNLIDKEEIPMMQIYDAPEIGQQADFDISTVISVDTSECFTPALNTIERKEMCSTTKRNNRSTKSKSLGVLKDYSASLSTLYYIPPDETPSPFETSLWTAPSILMLVLSCLGDPTVVCRMKTVNRFCNRIITENEYTVMKDAVRAGGIDNHMRPSFWLWITLEKCQIFSDQSAVKFRVPAQPKCDENEADALSLSDFNELERRGRESKWHHVIERDVNRAFGNMPPHKAKSHRKSNSIVRALISWGSNRFLLKRHENGTCRLVNSPSNTESEKGKPIRRLSIATPGPKPSFNDDSTVGDVDIDRTDTVSDWSGISPVSSTVSSKGTNGSVAGSISQELVLSSRGLTSELKIDLQKKLEAILDAIAGAHVGLGYCQGMDYVVAHLLRNLQETVEWNALKGSLPKIIRSAEMKINSFIDETDVVEEAVFRVMHTFLTTYNMQHMYWPELRCLKTCCRIFEHLIEKKLPVLADHFEYHELRIGMFALGWFQTLFLYIPSMPAPTINHMWDIWLVERSMKIFFRVATAILFLSQPILLNHDLEGMMQYLNTFPDATIFNPDILINCALQIKITNQMLEDIECAVVGAHENAYGM